MSYKKFESTDIILNTMRAAPLCEFIIEPGAGAIYYNNRPERTGKFVSNVLDVPNGFISLYELNIDRYNTSSAEHAAGVPMNPLIYSFIEKDSSRYSFKTVMTGSESDWDVEGAGTKLYAAYPFSASITREFMTGTTTQQYGAMGSTPTTFLANGAGQRIKCTKTGSSETAVLEMWPCSASHPHYYGLRQRLDYYKWRSPHYGITGSSTGSGGTPAWIKDQQKINLISIPSIFYGSRIKPGTVSCKMYYTGSLIGELVDNKRNGELIQVSSAWGATVTSGTNNVAGVVLYDEGFLVLTGSWNLTDDNVFLVRGSTGGSPVNPQWIYFGAGAQDGINYTTVTIDASTGDAPSNITFKLSFRGETETSVLTMFAHAKRGETNFSNNPTFIKHGQSLLRNTSSHVYEENTARTIKNTVSSSFTNQSASFKRQVYISRIGIYDEARNLIGIASLANPILKTDDDEYTFKLRVDL